MTFEERISDRVWSLFDVLWVLFPPSTTTILLFMLWAASKISRSRDFAHYLFPPVQLR